jgi:carbonic anhydrase
MDNQSFGLIDNWLRHVQDVMHVHDKFLDRIQNESERVDRLCELNVIEQVASVSRTTIVQTAWQRGQELVVHGWIYGLQDGLLRDLGISIDNANALTTAYRGAIQNICEDTRSW